jgi:hypothetical protein
MLEWIFLGGSLSTPSQPNFERIKKHVKKHKVAYSVGGVVVIAATSFVVGRYVGMRFGPNAWLNAKKIVIKENIFLIQTYERWTGPPSWMVRCTETNTPFLSQTAAAREMGLDVSTLSRHLNGHTAHVGGYHFERIAMAVPRNG